MDLHRLLAPRTVAVFGVSKSNPFHPANVIYTKNHLRYQARTFAINPSGGDLFGERIYRNIAEVPEPVDLAVLAVRADLVPATLLECIAAKVGGAVVISGGFAENGRADLQEELARIAHEHDFPVIGPNCLGIYAPPFIDAFFLPHERLVEPRPGRLALISQSGGILVDLMIELTRERVGVVKAISIGNKAVVDEVDLIAELDRDPAVGLIGLYLEGFKEGRGRVFVELARKLTKPLVVLKSGKTPGGSRAVSSHTASLAGDYAVFGQALREAGVWEARDEGEFVAYAEALSCYAQRSVRNVLVLTASGGHGAMAADCCYQRGLSLVEVPPDDRKALAEQLGPSVKAIAALTNPVDLTGSATDNDFFAAARFFMTKPYVDCILLLMLPYVPGLTSDVGARIALAARETKKPVIVYIPHVEKYEIYVEAFEDNGVPVSHSVEGAVFMAESLKGR